MRHHYSCIPAAILIGGVFAAASDGGDEGSMPRLGGAAGWINSAPLSNKALRGKVVLVNFWTSFALIACANCRT